MDIYHHTQDTEHKSCSQSCKGSHWVFELLELQNLPLPQQMMDKNKQCFWFRQDIESSEALE